MSIMMDSSDNISTISGCMKQDYRPRQDSIESSLQAGFGEEQNYFGDPHNKDIEMSGMDGLFSIM